MGKGQWQHYLPEVYLKGFAASTGEVWRYARDGDVLKLLGIPIIGAERDLYTIVTGDEVSREIETMWFSPLDGTFGPIRRKIENGDTLSANEVVDLANFVAYLRIRTPSMIRETEARHQQIDALLEPDPESIKYHSGPPDNGSDTYVVAKEQCEKVSPRRAESVRRNEVLRVLIKTGIQLANAILELEWAILVSPRERSFIVGDNPFVVVPPESHDVNVQGVGAMTPGATVFVPLSSRLCLRLIHSSVPGFIRRRVDGAAVRAVNACLLLNSEQYLFSSNDILLKRLVADLISAPGKNLAQVVFREAPSVSNESHSLVHWFTKSKIGAEWARKVPAN